ncbi:MAG: hypothetical protein GX256_06315 [Fretibacterium sp.]|nr:hypothetical protein [Fretibacterium sp.]
MKHVRRGGALPMVLVVLSVASALLGMLFTVLFEDWSFSEMEFEGVDERALMLSSANEALCRVREQLAAGHCPRVPDGVFSSFEARRVLFCEGRDGVRTEVYDMDYDPLEAVSPPSGWEFFFPPLEDGLLLRTRSSAEGPCRIIEAVHLVLPVLLPDGSVSLVLEEKPCAWRELWR